MSAGAFFHPQNAPKSLVAGALPELTTLPDPLAGLRGLLLRGERKREEGNGRGKGGREGKREVEGRDFRPSQCWKQIDATGRNSIINVIYLGSSEIHLIIKLTIVMTE